MNTNFLPETVDALAEAQARQTQYWVRLLGIEEESTEAREAHLRLQTALTMEYAETARRWAQAKRDAAAAAAELDRMVR